MKNVRPRIVANNIQIIFSTHNLRAINLRRQNCLAAGVRSSEKIPERIDDVIPSSRRRSGSSKRRGIVTWENHAAGRIHCRRAKNNVPQPRYDPSKRAMNSEDLPLERSKFQFPFIHGRPSGEIVFQQITAPIFPIAVSKPAASNHPRSPRPAATSAVGIIFRCLPM